MPGAPHTSQSTNTIWLWIKPILVLLLLNLSAPYIHAHDVSQSESKIEVQGHNIQALLKLNLLELGYVDKNGDGSISYDELDANIDRIYADVKNHYSIQSSSPLVRVALQRYSIVEDHLLEMELLYSFVEKVTRVEINSTLFQITQPGHQHLTSVDLDGIAHEGVLNSRNLNATFSDAEAARAHIFLSFLRLGVEHIFTGYDHLAFLVGLLIVTTSLGSLIKIITSFTVAHSITLAFASLNLVALPMRLTESMIPLTIAYVALENLTRVRSVERYQITFVFGLIHGFGFSNVLREMQLSRSHLALSLFSFNAGVELGQLTFVLILFPLILLVASTRWRLQFRSTVSVIVLGLAIYWFVQRAFLI